MKLFMDNLVSDYGDHETVDPQPGAGKSRDIEVFKKSLFSISIVQKLFPYVWNDILEWFVMNAFIFEHLDFSRFSSSWLRVDCLVVPVLGDQIIHKVFHFVL